MDDLPSAVLFACTFNAVRSPMASAFLRHFHGHRVFVDSVGVHPHAPDPFAIAVMDEVGIDISGHRPKTFAELEDDSFDLIISMSPEAQHSAVEMTRTTAAEVVYWRTFDPTVVEGSREVRLDAYRQVRDQIRQRVLERFPVHTMPEP